MFLELSASKFLLPFAAQLQLVQTVQPLVPDRHAVVALPLVAIADAAQLQAIVDAVHLAVAARLQNEDASSRSSSVDAKVAVAVTAAAMQSRLADAKLLLLADAEQRTC